MSQPVADYQLGWDAAAKAYKADIERLTAQLAHRDELEKFAAPLSCSTHGLVPNLALFDNKCPACERDRLRAAISGWDDHCGWKDGKYVDNVNDIFGPLLSNYQPSDTDAYNNARLNRVIARCPICRHAWYSAEWIGQHCPWSGCTGYVERAEARCDFCRCTRPEAKKLCYGACVFSPGQRPWYERQ